MWWSGEQDGKWQGLNDVNLVASTGWATGGRTPDPAPHAWLLTGVLVLSFRRSGISALLGLWALLTMGLEGGSPRLPLPAALQLAFRPGRRSSFSSVSPVLVGLRLGCRGAGDGPPGGRRGQLGLASPGKARTYSG